MGFSFIPRLTSRVHYFLLGPRSQSLSWNLRGQICGPLAACSHSLRLQFCLPQLKVRSSPTPFSHRLRPLGSFPALPLSCVWLEKGFAGLSWLLQFHVAYNSSWGYNWGIISCIFFSRLLASFSITYPGHFCEWDHSTKVCQLYCSSDDVSIPNCDSKSWVGRVAWSTTERVAKTIKVLYWRNLMM